MSDDVVIRMEHGWKRYGTTLTNEFKRLWHRPGGLLDQEKGWTLRDLNFEVRRGETLGVIGRNGCGKSTLLKVLAGVSPITYGQVTVLGRIFPMIELNAGMHMDLTGRQNVHLLGAVMGFTPQEVETKVPAIEDFCELGEWFDRPVWMYSSGMLARLGFAVAVNVDAEVLLIDEVLAVGDRAFQNKCLARLHEMRKDGRTRVFVSHNLDQVQYLCREVLVLDRGYPLFLGPSENAIRLYERHISLEQSNSKTQVGEKAITTSSLGLGVEVIEIRINSQVYDQKENIQIAQGTEMMLEFRVKLKKYYQNCTPMFASANNEGIPIWFIFANEHGLNSADYSPGTYNFTVKLPPLYLREGRYFVHFGFRNISTYETFERYANIASFLIIGSHNRRQRELFILAPPANCQVTVGEAFVNID